MNEFFRYTVTDKKTGEVVLKDAVAKDTALFFHKSLKWLYDKIVNINRFETEYYIVERTYKSKKGYMDSTIAEEWEKTCKPFRALKKARGVSIYGKGEQLRSVRIRQAHCSVEFTSRRSSKLYRRRDRLRTAHKAY